MSRDIIRQMSSIDESDWGLFTKDLENPINLLVKGTVHTQIIKTLATSNVAHLTKSLKMNNVTGGFLSASVTIYVRQHGGYCWIEKRWNTIGMFLERLRTRALESLEGFPMYMHYEHVSTITTESTDSLIGWRSVTKAVSQHATSRLGKDPPPLVKSFEKKAMTINAIQIRLLCIVTFRHWEQAIGI